MYYFTHEANRSQSKDWNMYVKSTGLTEDEYADILYESDSNHKMDPTQEELNGYLDFLLGSDRITEEQARGVWETMGWETSYDKYKADKERKAVKQALLKVADDNENGRLTQEELGSYLLKEVKANRMTKAEAEEIWTAQGKGWKKTFEQWSGTESKSAAAGKLNPKIAEQPEKITSYESFQKKVPIYRDNIDAAYELYWTEVAPLGIGLDQYSQIVIEANADGKNTSTQDEMGYYLLKQIQSLKITQQQAEAIWYTIWHSKGSKTFQKWLQGK